MELIETMLVTEGSIENFELHIKRVKKTFDYFKWKFNQKEWEKLKKIDIKKLVRLRVTYNQNGITDIEFFNLKKREFNKFKLINIDFDYPFKFKNRKKFQYIHSRYKSFDEFILIKNSLVTDTTISNLAFFTGKEWITPRYPLLKGTKREELIKKGFLKEEIIKKRDLKYFKKFAMINSILGFYERDIKCIF